LRAGAMGASQPARTTIIDILEVATQTATQSAAQALVQGAAGRAVVTISINLEEAVLTVTIGLEKGPVAVTGDGRVRVFCRLSPADLQRAAEQLPAEEFVRYAVKQIFPAGGLSQFKERYTRMLQEGRSAREMLEDMIGWLCSLLRSGKAAPADRRSESPLKAWEEFCARDGGEASSGSGAGAGRQVN